MKTDSISNHLTKNWTPVRLNPDSSKSELKRSVLVETKKQGGTLKKFYIFPDSIHQHQQEQSEGQIRLDDNYPYDGANG